MRALVSRQARFQAAQQSRALALSPPSSLRGRVSTAALVAFGVLMPVLAFAQTGVTTGVSATPTTAVSYDYGGLATTFRDGLTPILSAVFPVCVVMMAIWYGPSLWAKVVRHFAH